MIKGKVLLQKFKKPAVMLGAASVTLGTMTVVGATPEAQAYNGREDPSTGIVWGVGQDGSYKVPLQSGGEKQGWCIDPGAAYPKQNGPYGSKLYGAAKPWNTTLTATDKKKLAIALIIGKGIESGQINRQTVRLIDAINKGVSDIRNGLNVADGWLKGVPGAQGIIDQIRRDLPDRKITKDINKIAAGVSGVVHEVGNRDRSPNKPPYTKPWSASRISDPDARYIYDLIMKYSHLIPNFILPKINFSIRSSLDNGRQRMILMDDIKIDFGVAFTVPSFPPVTPPPGVSDVPGTSSTTPSGSSTTPTQSTRTVSTTPSTRSTTPETPTPKEEPNTPNPEVRTNAGTKSENVVENGATIVDTVTYKNLEPGQKYRLTGETVDKATGEKDGNKGDVEFSPETPNGRIDVPITLNNPAGQELVVFETLEVERDGEWEKVAEHADINDAAQTVGRLARTPQIGTSAESSTGNDIQTGTVVNDTVRYQGLIPGKQYRLEARLMCKATGQDTGAVQNHTFTPESENGQTVVQNIAVTNPDCLEQVVFEKLYDDQGYLVATHEDINDAAQTFGGAQPSEKKKKLPEKTAPAPEKPNGPIAQANANAEANPAPAQVVPLGAPAPAGMGGGSAPAPAPRQVIGSVPSGEATGYGSTIFNR